MIDTPRIVLRAGLEVDARADRAHSVLEIEVLTTAQRATADVVLLGWHDRRLPIGRDHGGSQVIRDTRSLVLSVEFVAVLEHDRVEKRETRGVDDEHLATSIHAVHVRADDGRRLAWLRRRNEA